MSCFIFSNRNLEDSFCFENYSLNNVKIKSRGTLEHKYIEDTYYEECWLFDIEKTNGIEEILWYPDYNNRINRNEGKIVINKQIFIFKDYGLYVPEVKLYSINYNEKTYLLIMGNIGKYGNKRCFIFDITDSDSIAFYQPESKFICKEMAEHFVGIYNNKLCFFFSTKRYEWNGQYKLAPYYIEGDSLKQLCDKNGKPYFVDYSYKTKYEQEYVIDDKYIPPRETDKVQ